MKGKEFTGKEHFMINGEKTGLSIIDFWIWNSRHLEDLKDKIAVFLISEALQSESSCNMNKWDAHRVMYSDKHVGIKCATVINEESKEGKRNEKFYHIIDKEADYYIFCKVVLVGRSDKSMLNLNNWFFYIIPNWYLVSESGNNNRISIKKIERMVQATGILDIKTKLDSMIKNE